MENSGPVLEGAEQSKPVVILTHPALVPSEDPVMGVYVG